MSMLATAAGLTVMSLMNVAQGMFQVEGEMWDFLCVIRTLGSWGSFNCHPKLLILPKNVESEESY